MNKLERNRLPFFAMMMAFIALSMLKGIGACLNHAGIEEILLMYIIPISVATIIFALILAPKPLIRGFMTICFCFFGFIVEYGMAYVVTTLLQLHGIFAIITGILLIIAGLVAFKSVNDKYLKLI